MSKKKANTLVPVNEKYVKEIITDYEKLSERAPEFDLTKNSSNLQPIVLSLKNTIRSQKDISGLTACQIGSPFRVLCLNFDGDIRTFVNPIITNVKGLIIARETCHSLPGKEYLRLRHPQISVTYQTPLAKIESVTLKGMAAIVFQHEIDHLDGILLSDIGLEIDQDFDKATDEEKQQIIDMYLDSFDLRKEQLEKEIKANKKDNEAYEGVKFLESVAKGETQLESFELSEKELEERKAFNEELEKQLNEEKKKQKTSKTKKE